MQRGEILAQGGAREETRGQTVNHQPPLPAAVASSSSNSSVLSPAASQALTMYMRCLENGGWCRLVLEGNKERQNFKIECREPAPAVTTATTSACPATRRRKRANRPLNPRRQERERRRRAAWLERRESRQQPGPLTTPTPATARVNVSGAAGDLPAATAATSATLQSAESSQGKQPTSTAKVKRPKPPSEGTRQSQRTAVLAKKAGERPESLRYDDSFQIGDLNISGISVEAERDLSLSQIDEEVMEPERGTAAPHPWGRILCTICNAQYHTWCYAWCKSCSIERKSKP